MAESTAKVGKIASLRSTVPGPGRVVSILVRPKRRAEIVHVEEADVAIGFGLRGDHFSGGIGSKRQVTLIAVEDLSSIASFLGIDEVSHAATRRNILTKGINLLALKDRTFRVGTALLEYAGQCSPCSLMEQTIASGAYQAMRFHGGIIARVINAGKVSVGDEIRFEGEQSHDGS